MNPLALKLDERSTRKEELNAARMISRYKIYNYRKRLVIILCKHKGWSFNKHGRCCHTCGEFMIDFGGQYNPDYIDEDEMAHHNLRVKIDREWRAKLDYLKRRNQYLESRIEEVIRVSAGGG